ncbi:MAG: serine hydrolase [Alphaproteobacteria bacterium]|nr:serine hydrolase [Alphaproteobacteria bacterium]
MQGFPPAAGGQVTLANWRTAPFNKWAFQHVREIVPSADIANDPEDVWRLPSAPADLAGLRIDGDMDLHGFLAETDTDALVVLHRGRIVAESYGNGMTAATPHILMSVSKSMLGMLAGILEAQGKLDLAAPVTSLVPEVGGTAYKGATIRQLLDMRAGILFDENYLATSGPIIAYRKSTNWNPLEPGEKPTDLRSFYPQLGESDGPHGGRFHYVSPNTDLLGWVIERAAGERYADVMSRLVWRPLGAERSAYITVDRLGAPRCAGGFCGTARDLARVGQLLVQDGKRGAKQVVPAAWIDDVETKGDRTAWDKGDFTPYYPGMPIHYRSKWYVWHGASPMLFCLGVNGQNLFVDRKNQIVIAKFSSQAMPMDERRILLTMRAAERIREVLRTA